MRVQGKGKLMSMYCVHRLRQAQLTFYMVRTSFFFFFLIQKNPWGWKWGSCLNQTDAFEYIFFMMDLYIQWRNQTTNGCRVNRKHTLYYGTTDRYISCQSFALYDLVTMYKTKSKPSILRVGPVIQCDRNWKTTQHSDWTLFEYFLYLSKKKSVRFSIAKTLT